MGSLNWEVSALGFGCMRLPSRRFNKLRAQTDKSVEVVRFGIDLGINYVDTAWPYHLGDSEKILGLALNDGYRERVRLVTKLPLFIVTNANQFDKYLKTQLKRLQTDHLDAYLFHAVSQGGFNKIKKLGLIRKMEAAKKEGLIGAIGFSFHDTLPVFKEIVDYYPWDLVQIQYNYMDTAIQATTEGLEYAAGKGMAVVIMEPLKGGTLVNPSQAAMDIINTAGRKRTPTDWALQFLWNKPEVSVVLSGMSTEQMVAENCTSAHNSGINSLNQKELEVIARLTEEFRKNIIVPCTSCAYCMPCPHGVNIPQNFACLNNLSLEKSRFRRIMTRRYYRKLQGKKYKITQSNPNGNAALCVECGDCLEKCPQKIQIPQELKKVRKEFATRKAILW
jgi:predicted aldo/keto reductase-like oxidoreductase